MPPGGRRLYPQATTWPSPRTSSLLFVATAGKTFIAPWKKGQKDVQAVYPVPFKSSAGGNKSSHVALCQWREVPQHPGLLCCLTHTTGVPVVLMVKPRQILVTTKHQAPPWCIVLRHTPNVTIAHTRKSNPGAYCHVSKLQCCAVWRLYEKGFLQQPRCLGLFTSPPCNCPQILFSIVRRHGIRCMAGTI